MDDVLTIGSNKTKIDGRSKKKIEEEARKKGREIADKLEKKQFRTQFLQIYDEVTRNDKTVEEVLEEVKQKKSRITFSARDFIQNFDNEKIKRWINEEIKMREEGVNDKMQNILNS